MNFVYPNCTLPAEPFPRFVGASIFRSITDILRYCIVAMAISVWSAQRPNVAPATTSETPCWWKRIWQEYLSRPATKFVWMCIMLAAPDIVFARAAANLFAAWLNNRELKKLADHYKVEWSLMHTMTTNMGGVRITFDAETSIPGSHKRLAKDAARGSDAEKYRGASRMETEVWIVDPLQLIKAYDCGIIASLPNIPAKEIDDKNKSNSMVFLGAVMPLTYAALQLGARYYQDLPSTLLEIETLAFVTCAVPLYFIDMKKPMDLNVPFDIPASKCATLKSFKSVAAAAPKPMMGWKREYCSPGITNGSIDKTENGSRLSYVVMDCALISMAVLFGGIHLFAWNYDFRTEIEQLLWRMAVLSAMVLPILWVVVGVLESYLPVAG